MSRSEAIGVAFVMGIFVLAVALFVPALIDTTQGDATDYLSTTNLTNEELTDKLSVTVDNVNATNATVTYTDNTTLATNTTTVDVGNVTNISLSGDYIETGLQSTDGDSVTMNVTYPPMFGWDSAPRTFVENIEIVLVILGFLMVGSILMMVLDP